MDKKELLALIEQLSEGTAKRIDKAISTLDKDVKGLESELLNLMLEDLLGKLSFTDGKLNNSAANISQINKLDKLFRKFRQNFLDTRMRDFGIELLDIAALTTDYYSAMGFDAGVIDRIKAANDAIKARIGLEGAQNRIVEGSYLDSLAQTPELKKELRTLMLSEMASKRSVAQVTRNLADFIKTNAANVDGALTRYYRQYAYDTYNQIYEIKNQEFATGLGLTYFIYVGDIIVTSRAFCAKKAGKVFSTKDAEKWRDDPDLVNKKSKASYVPLIEKGRYNCRHQLCYISESMAKRLAPEKFGAKPKYDFSDEYDLSFDISPDAKKLLGDKNISPNNLLKLSGGIPMKGLSISEVVIRARFGDSLHLNVISKDIVQERLIDFENKTIKNEVFKVRNEAILKGENRLGAKMLYTEITEAKKFGFEKIKTDAYKSEGWNGYYTWARCGYDFEKPENFRIFAKEFGRKEKSILDLMSTKEGRDFWKKNGERFDAVFDINNENQFNILKKYLDE